MVNKFFQTKTYYESRYDAAGRCLGFKARNKDEWLLWKSEVRGTLYRLLGLDRMVSCPPNPRVTEEIQCDGYRRQRVEIDTEPGVTMPLYVLIPDGPARKLSPIIAAHGHLGGGKIATAGVTEIPGVTEAILQLNYDYGLKCAQRGYMVFCPDARGMGERRESLSEGSEYLFSSSCNQLLKLGLPLGITVIGTWIWDLMRLLDFIQSRPECAGQKIGCIGLSGGGLQTLYLAALEERIACAVVSGYFYGVRDSILSMSCCECNYVPHLWEYIDMGDLAAMIAPRPLLIETGSKDDLNGARGVINTIEQVEIARQAYTLFEASDHLAHDIFEGEHRWNGIQAYPWLDHWLR